jgi:outer membrane biosynthesis protein TonB
MKFKSVTAAIVYAMSTTSLMAAAPPRLMNPGPWRENLEAPADTLKRGEIGMTAIDLTLAPDGTVQKCDVVYSTHSGSLEDHACALFKNNARYEPAGAGQPDGVRTRREFLNWSASKNAPDAKTSRATAAAPRAGSESWVTTDDLPKGVLRKDEIVTSNVGLSINPEGSIDGCWVTLPSERPKLDELVCTLMKQRARYKPARDAQGEPDRGFAFTTVRWQVPVD